jgi:thiosulfate reductase cytochrome b subunit
MTTTGHTPTSNIQAMLTGYEDIEEEHEKPDEV